MITKRQLRRRALYAIAHALKWVPDRVMLSAQYWVWTKHWMNWKDPRRFSEKIQFYKAYYRDARMFPCTDKYLVRQYVKEQLGGAF